MRLNTQSYLARSVDVYLNGEKQDDAIEVYIPGNVLEGEGYVYRAIRDSGNPKRVLEVKGPLAPGQYNSDGIIAEKVCGQVRIEIMEYPSLFETQLTERVA